MCDCKLDISTSEWKASAVELGMKGCQQHQLQYHPGTIGGCRMASFLTELVGQILNRCASSYSDVPVAHFLAGPRSILSPMSILHLYISIGSLLQTARTLLKKPNRSMQQTLSSLCIIRPAAPALNSGPRDLFKCKA